MKVYNKKYQIIETYGLLLLDILCIVISYIMAYMLRFSMMNGNAGEEEVRQVCIFLIMVSLFYNIFSDSYKHFFKRGYYVELVSDVKYNVFLVVTAGCYVYAFRLEVGFSRLALGYFFIFNLFVTFLVRIFFKKFMSSFYKNSKESDKIMIITTASEVDTVVRHLERDAAWSYEVTSMVLMDVDKVGEMISGIPVVANKDNVIDVARQSAVDVVFIHCPKATNEELEWLIQSFQAMGVVCHNCLERLIVDASYCNVGKFAGFPVMTYSLTIVDYRWKIVKRLMDLLGGIVGLFFTALITPFVAIAIKLDSPGPVFFSQTRIGKNGRRFQIYKFRSMYVDAEKRKKDLMDQNEMKGLMFKMENDPRITKVGRFIRRTSIDELPQFWNVVRGDMSLVGTRPPTVEEFERYNIYYRRRLSITPGLTGMWQVSGRSDITDFDEVVKLDLKYIDEWSVGKDIKILLQTVQVVLFGRGSK